MKYISPFKYLPCAFWQIKVYLSHILNCTNSTIPSGLSCKVHSKDCCQVSTGIILIKNLSFKSTPFLIQQLNSFLLANLLLFLNHHREITVFVTCNDFCEAVYSSQYISQNKCLKYFSLPLSIYIYTIIFEFHCHQTPSHF